MWFLHNEWSGFEMWFKLHFYRCVSGCSDEILKCLSSRAVWRTTVHHQTLKQSNSTTWQSDWLDDGSHFSSSTLEKTHHQRVIHQCLCNYHSNPCRVVSVDNLSKPSDWWNKLGLAAVWTKPWKKVLHLICSQAVSSCLLVSFIQITN